MIYYTQRDNAAIKGIVMTTYLKWRGKSLYCSYPVSWFSETYPLGIYTTGSPTDTDRCWKLGERILAEIRVRLQEGKVFKIENGKLFEISEKTETVHRPTYYELFCHYWVNFLKKKSTAHTLFSDIKHSLLKFGKQYHDEVTNDAIEKWRTEMERRKLSKSSIRNRVSYIRAIYNHAKRVSDPRYHVEKNPCDYIKPLKTGEPRRFCLTPDKFERNYRFFKSINPDFAFFYLLAWECFRRPEEVASYRLEYIDWKRRTILIPGEITKTEEPDEIPFSDRAWTEITSRHTEGSTGLICKTSTNTPWLYHSNGKKHVLVNNTKRWMKKLRAEYGADAGWFRDTRAGGITNLCDLGVDPKIVGALSGHKDIRSVMRYNKRTIDRMREAQALKNHTPAPVPAPPPAPQENIPKDVPSSKILAFRRKIAS